MRRNFSWNGGRPWSTCEVHTETDIQEIVCEGVDWIYLARDKDQWGRAVGNTERNPQVS